MSVYRIMQRANLLDWHTLILGLERGWCGKEHLIEYAEECLRGTSGNIDEDLVNLVEGDALSRDELLLISYRFLEKTEHPISAEEKCLALDKWRFAHLTALREGSDPPEVKLNLLQELYSQFGFPEDMAACSIYSNDGVDPLEAAQSAADKLAQKLAI